MLGSGDDICPLRDETKRRLLGPPDGLDGRLPELPCLFRSRMFVESSEFVPDPHLAYASP
jgi:hypothetical protein